MPTRSSRVRWQAVAGMAAFLALVAWVLWSPGGEAGAARGPEAAVSEAGAEAGLGAGREAAAPQPEAPAVSREPEVLPPTWSEVRGYPEVRGDLVFLGRCVTDGGGPLAGAEVTLTSRPRSRERVAAGRSLPAIEPVVVTTGEDGIFLIRRPPVREHAIHLSFTSPGHMAMRVNGPDSGVPRLVDLGDVALPEGVPVTGIARTVDGEPVEQVRVRIGTFAGPRVGSIGDVGIYAYSDESGHVRFDSAVPPGTHVLEWRKTGYRMVEGPEEFVVDASDTEARFELVLEPGASVSGHVFSDQGEPAVGASVRAVAGEARSRARRVAEDGSFRVFDSGEVPEPFALEISSRSDWRTTVTAEEFRWGDDDVRLTAERTPYLDLLVVEKGSGAPVEDYAVHRMQPGGGGDPVATGLHPGGRARVGGFRDGWNVLQVYAADAALRPSERMLFEWQGSGERRVELERMRPVRIRVVDAAGLPVEGVTVALVDQETDGWYLDAREEDRSMGISLEAERDGLFAEAYSSAVSGFDGLLTAFLPEGAAQGIAVLTAPRGIPGVALEFPQATRGFAVPASPDEVVELEVAVGGALRGTLIHPQVVEGTVGLVMQGGSNGAVDARRIVRPEADGSFVASGLRPGTCFPQLVLGLQPRHLGPSDGVTWYPECVLGEFTIIEGEETVVSLDATGIQAGGVRGRVWLDGEVAAGLPMRLDEEGWRRGAPPTGSLYLRLDGAGRFEVPVIRPGRYRVMLMAPRGLVYSDDVVEVIDGESVRADFRCHTRRLELVILDEQGEPLAEGTRLNFSGGYEHDMNRGPDRGPAKAGPGGTYTAYPAPAGLFWVTVYRGKEYLDSDRVVADYDGDSGAMTLRLHVRQPYDADDATDTDPDADTGAGEEED